MQQIERNVIESFRRAKNDIIQIQNQLNKLAQAQEKIMEHIHAADDKRESLLRKIEVVSSRKPTKVTRVTKVTKVVRAAAPRKPKVIIDRPNRKKYVGSTESKIYHLTSARIAKMIKPKNRVYNDSPTYLQKLGMKPSRELKIAIKKAHQRAGKKAQKTLAKKAKKKSARKARK